MANGHIPTWSAYTSSMTHPHHSPASFPATDQPETTGCERPELPEPPDLSHIAEPLRGLAMPIASVALDPANARLHAERNLAAVGASLRVYGQRKPIVVRRAGMIVTAGNGTLEAAKRLGWTHIAAVVVDDDPITATGYAIADNRTAELATWDEAALGRLLKELKDEDINLDELGWSDDDLAALVDELEGAPADEAGGEDAGPTEPPEAPVSEEGVIYALGPHRLLCGDSTDKEAVARLMGEEKAVLIATDPPYLINYQGGNHPQSWANKAEVKDKHWDDYTDPSTGAEFYTRFLEVALVHAAPGVAIYQWHAHKRQALVEDVWTRAGLLVHQQIIWAKARAVLTRSHFMWQHEPCFYGWVQGTPPTRRPPSNETTVWPIDQKGSQDGIHPTQKPLELFLRPIRWHTEPGDLCYEPFGGSGTCLIAAALEGRRCYAVEKSPAFCDVIRKRWGDYARSADIEPGEGAL
jgi:DNA modification methylase